MSLLSSQMKKKVRKAGVGKVGQGKRLWMEMALRSDERRKGADEHVILETSLGKVSYLPW
jgi:hypothetical protein